MLAHTLPTEVNADGQVSDLIGQGLLDNQEAFIKLDAMFRPQVLDFLARKCGNYWLADELANETFLRAFRSLPSYRGRSRRQFLSFLFSIASNLLRDHFRSQSRSSAGIPSKSGCEPDIDCIESDKSDGGNCLEADERKQMLRQALDSLPADQARLIKLSHLKGLKAQQIAEILGKPNGQAVRASLCRAMKDLKTVLQRQGYFEQATV